MTVPFVSRRVLKTVVFTFVFAAFSVVIPAYGQAIQPCEATPSPTKSAIATEKTKASVSASQTLIDASIPNDPDVDKLIAPYSERVRELSLVIGQLDGEIKSGGVGASSIGQLVTNAMMSSARSKLGSRVDVVITNAGGLRKSAIQSGDLRASDIFELLPFENALIELEFTGTQLLTILQRVTADRFAQAGARIQFRWNEQNRPEMISAKLVDAAGNEREIEPTKTYVVVTIDYLVKLNSGNYAILKDAQKSQPLNLTIRDAVISYIKAETAAGRKVRSALDDRFIQIGPDPVRAEGRP